MASSNARADIIRKRGSKWLVLTEAGDRVLGEHDTEEAARKQLAVPTSTPADPDAPDALGLRHGRVHRDPGRSRVARTAPIEASMAREDAPAKYSHISFKPPAGVRAAAKRGLDFRSREGGGGGTEVGVARARDLSGGKNISPETARRMANFFSRHQGGSRKIDPKFKGEPWRDRGYVAWLLWGGDAGRSWADKLVRQMNAADKRDTKGRANRVDFLEPLRVDSARMDDTTGFMTVDARLTRTGVFPYEDGEGNRWGELRVEDEVFDPESMKSFEGVVVTNEHPDGFVTTDNVRRVQVGHVGTDVRRDGDYLRATVTITDPDTIAAIKDGKVEVSCGYTAEVVPADGTLDGQAYSAKQTRIRGNHLAVVDEGRAGPGARLLLDAAYSVRQNGETPMSTEKKDAMIAIGEREFEVPEEVANHMQAMAAELAEARDMARESESSEVSDMESEEKSEDMSMESKETDGKSYDSALLAKVDSLEAELASRRDSEAARIDARVALVSSARDVLGAKFDHVGKSDADIQRAVVLAVTPAMAERLERNHKDGGYLRAAYDNALDTHAREQESISDSYRVTFDAASGASKETLDDVHDEYIRRISGRKESK